MSAYWFFAGVVTTLACTIISMHGLRRIPRLASLPAPHWAVTIGAAAVAIGVLAGSHWVDHEHRGSAAAAAGFGQAMQVFNHATDASAATAAAGQPAAAGSMQSAIASLEAKLAKGGGSPGDWELLAKAFDFIGRPADAALARAHQLPSLNATAGTTISGEIDLAASIAGKAKPGEPMFVFAQSVDSPGPPVAVFRTTVGTWPLHFTLNDSESMIPGRNLSNAGRVKIEARISASGQPLASAGDLEGASAVIAPRQAQHPLKIVIDRIVP